MSDYVEVVAPSGNPQEGRMPTLALPLTLIWNYDDPREASERAAPPFHDVIAISDSQSYDAYKENLRQKIWYCKHWDTGKTKRWFMTTAQYYISDGEWPQEVSFGVYEENWSATMLLFRRPDVRAPSLIVDFWLVPLDTNNDDLKINEKEQAGTCGGSDIPNDDRRDNPPPYDAPSSSGLSSSWTVEECKRNDYRRTKDKDAPGFWAGVKRWCK